MPAHGRTGVSCITLVEKMSYINDLTLQLGRTRGCGARGRGAFPGSPDEDPCVQSLSQKHFCSSRGQQRAIDQVRRGSMEYIPGFL